MQEKRVRNRERERYLHELHKLRESAERQRQMEFNERLLKKKSDIGNDPASPDPNLVAQLRGASPLVVPEKPKKKLGRPPKPPSKTDFSSFGRRIPLLKQTDFVLPEFYFNI